MEEDDLRLSILAGLVSSLTLCVGCARSSPANDLLEAARSCDLSGVKAALAEKADVNAESKGDTPLINAARNGCLDVVKTLLSAGANVNASTREPDMLRLTGHTALMTASWDEGSSEVVKALIAAGADVNLKDSEGMSALAIAAENNQLESVRALAAAGADVNARDKHGDTTLDTAARYGRLKTVETLVSLGAGINLQGAMGLSPLAESLSARQIMDTGNFGTEKDHVAVDEFLRQHGGRDLGRQTTR